MFAYEIDVLWAPTSDQNIISEKFRGAFVKFLGSSYFPKFQIYFYIEKAV
jgi:hypothetical protein